MVRFGRIAQLVEPSAYNAVVGGSSPSAPTAVVITTFWLVRTGFDVRMFLTQTPRTCRI
jgi:hypothetical protein